MPIFFQQHLANDTKLGIWKIEEEEDFFLKKVIPQRNVSHPHKRLQHLAGRYLLRYLFADFPIDLILLADTRKPYLKDEAYHFSISHCGNYAAALVSKTKRTGVDIEIPTVKVARIKNKFLDASEITIACGGGEIPIEKLTLLWSAKEAVFKWFGNGEVDFREHIVVQKIKQISDQEFDTEICFKKEDAVLLHVHSCFFAEIVLSYVVT